MKKSKYSDAQIIAALMQVESGVPVADLCREHGMSSASFYKWRSKYGGMDATLMMRAKEQDKEGKRLKKCMPSATSELCAQNGWVGITSTASTRWGTRNQVDLGIQ